MKTILVAFTKKKIDDLETLNNSKGYSFNTDADVKPGDIIVTDNYSTYLQVINVLPNCYKYYNYKTGELFEESTSGSNGEIKVLVLNKTDESGKFYGFTR